MIDMIKATLRALIALMALLAFARDASAVVVDNLYQAKAIVTGQREENRGAGFAACLHDVLIKVSGDPLLGNDPRVAALADKAGEYIRAFHYRDQMEGIPVHDEQGTRDRPYDLTCDFEPAKIDAALQSLGRKPWPAERPRLAVLLAVRNGPSAYVLSEDGRGGPGQRESFLAASWKLGVPIVLPKQAALAEAGLTVDKLWAAPPEPLAALAPSFGGERVLIGHMEFSDAALGWVAEWRLADRGMSARWSISGVNFDEVFRTAMRGAAQILSGRGAPN